MNALEIVREHLKANGYDGLFNCRGDCGCELSGLSPGNCLTEYCAPGYKVPCDPEDCPAEGQCEWHIAPQKVRNDPR
jgi:hypothetical protein